MNEGEGVSFLLAEQNTNVALRYAHAGYILENRARGDGRDGQALRENDDVKEFYLGVSDEGGDRSAMCVIQATQAVVGVMCRARPSRLAADM